MAALMLSLMIFVCFWSPIRSIPPTIDSVIPKVATLYQYEKSSVTLSTVNCTDPDNGTCSVSLRVYPTNPCGNCFTLLPCGSSGTYCVKFLPGQGSFTPSSVSQYILTVTATDEKAESDPTVSSDVVDIRIKPNALPVFGTLTAPVMTATASVLNTKNLNTGALLYTVPAVDPEGDALTFTMTTVPHTDNLKIDSLSGQIRAVRSLRYECQSNIAVMVYVQDSVNTGTQVGPFVVSLELVGANSPPIINNLNSELRVREGEAVGSSVLTFATFDDDPLEMITYTASTSPSTAANLFEIKASSADHELLVKSPLDYETQPQTITMTIKATDRYCPSDTYTLTIKLVDINEPPYLGPIDQTIESCEGLVDITPKWNATDPDIHDKVRFIDIQPNKEGRFSINEDTGVVSTLVDYDVDQKTNGMPPTVTLEATLSDRQGLTTTATLIIRFIDCNDNHPIFGKNTYLVEFKDCDPPGYIAKTVVKAEDLDSEYEQNNVITYSGSGAGVEVQPGGTVVLTSALEAGTAMTFEVYATDHGKTPGPLRSKSPAYVSVYSTPCDTPPPPSDKVTTENMTITTTPMPANTADFLKHNLGWIVAAALAAALLSALSLFLLYRFCWPRIRHFIRQGCCKRHPPPRSVTPARRPTPPPKERDPGFIFGWWKEKYPNDDYNRVPDRSALPEPSKNIDTPIDTNTHDIDPVVPPSPPPPKSCTIL